MFKTKKAIIVLCISLAVLLAAGSGILIWQLSKPETYTVSFVTNGGNEIDSIEVEKGTVLSQEDLPVPSKRGELFLTWNTDEALTVPYWNMSIERDTTLYASYIEPANDATERELTQSIIPFATTDFSVTVRSAEELTNDSIGQYIVLTVNYGKHENGEKICLSVTSEASGVYRLSGNFAPGGEYVITLISDKVTFNPEDEVLSAYGLTDALRMLRFRIIGESYVDGELSDKVADIPDEAIAVKADNLITVSGSDRKLIGATEDDNAVIRVGKGGGAYDYYKIVGVESASGDGITYKVRPAEADEVYDHATGYQWEDFDGDDLVINEEVKAQVMENLANNEQLNNYVKYLGMAATYTPTYQSMVTQNVGSVSPMPVENIVVTPAGVTVGLNKKAYNEHFVNVLGSTRAHNFVKLTLGIKYEVKLAKLGSVGSITAEVGLQVDFWIWLGVGGQFELGWFEYDIDCGTTILTQTEITFSIGLMTSDAKKAVNINDEIEAIYNSAKDPSPENLLEQYNELMSGGSKPIELFNRNIFEMPILSLAGGLVKVSIPVRFAVTLDVEATFTSYVTVLTGDDFGIKGNEDTGLDALHNQMNEMYLYRMELRGHVELKTGFEAGIELSLGFGLAKVSMNVQAGVYAEIYGYFFYEVDCMDRIARVKNQGGAYYFEFGLYLDVKLRAEVCKIKYNGNLWGKKWPFFSAGQKEILYGFVNPTGDVIDLEGLQFVHIEDTGILDVYVLDITEERSDKNPRKVEDFSYGKNKHKFNISFSNGAFYITGDNYIAVSGVNDGTIFEATMIINYTGAQLSFRDTLTKYVTVRYSRDENLVWSNVGKTYNLNFTIDGEVIFTRKYSYGSTICFEPYDEKSYYLNTHLDHYFSANGTLITELRGSEQEALYNAGYSEAHWYIMKKSDTSNLGEIITVTEDMTFEADSDVKRRPWNVTVTENGVTSEYRVNHGEKLKLPFSDVTEIYSDDYIYKFAGWISESGDVFSAGTEYVITGDLNLTPRYLSTERKYSVTFDGNGGKVGNGSETFTTQFFYGEMPEYPFTPEREGTDNVRYEFIGWSPTLSKVDEDVTYKAQWKEIKRYTVTFEAGKGQFDEDGKRTFTFTVDEGHVLSEADIPTNPYTKAEGGYYEFEAWSAAVSAGTVINGNVTYTATYKDKLTRATGILISDGVNTEDIASFLDGTNKVSGYTYTLNTEFYGNSLEITKPGLTVSGNATDINITVANTEVTLHNLTLVQNSRIEIITSKGKATLNIGGDVKLFPKTDAEAIRVDYNGEYDPVNGGYIDFVDAHTTVRGVNGSSKLYVEAYGYGIAAYGKLNIENLRLEISMPMADAKDPETGMIYGAVALQVHNHPKGILTVVNSDITVNGGVVNAAWLEMISSNLTFTAEKFIPGYSHGIFMMNYYEMTELEPLIVLKASRISFKHGIAIAVAASTADGDKTYFVNTSMNTNGLLETYPSVDAFIAEANAKGYGRIIDMDGASSIE